MRVDPSEWQCMKIFVFRVNARQRVEEAFNSQVGGMTHSVDIGLPPSTAAPVDLRTEWPQ